jgi:hypothetical protein
MPKTTTKPKAGSQKRGAGKSASRKATKKVANKTLGKKAAKKAAGKTPGKKAAKKADNPLIPTRKRKGMLLLNPKPMTARQKARLIRAFQMAYEDHQRQLSEMANQPQEDFQCLE